MRSRRSSGSSLAESPVESTRSQNNTVTWRRSALPPDGPSRIVSAGDSLAARILRRAQECGASSAFLTLLRLPREVREVFESRLREAFPDRVGRVLSALEDMRRGQDRGAFGQRMRGRGPRWDSVVRLFDVHCRRLGLATSADEEVLSPLVPPAVRLAPGARPRVSSRPRWNQGLLFEDLA